MLLVLRSLIASTLETVLRVEELVMEEQRLTCKQIG